jgi:hypothetical protein
MRPFDHPNMSHGFKCPICKTNDDKPVVLIGVNGTQDDGIIEGHQYHLDCIDLLEYDLNDKTLIAQQFIKGE